MASSEPRPAPWIHVSWLAKIMSGDNPCHFQGWFLAHHKLLEKVPSDFDLVSWKMDHTRMLSELVDELGTVPTALAVKEQEIRYRFDDPHATLSGSIDCLCQHENELIVYDCKTGQIRDSDQVQIMLYMWMLSQKEESSGKLLKGVVVYKKRRVRIEKLPDGFEDQLDYFVRRICSETRVIPSPGSACRFCDITKTDCKDRVETHSLS